jgi:hypothetical protein
MLTRCKCLPQRASLLAVHLGVDDPWCTVPRRRVEGSPKVEEEDSADAPGRELTGWIRVARRVGDLDVRSNVPHAEGTSQGSEHKEFRAAEAID